MKNKFKIGVTILIITVVLISVYILIKITIKPSPVPETEPDVYSLSFLLIKVTRGGISNSFITPSEHILPNCEIQKWGGEQLPCNSGVDSINYYEHNESYCREKNLLICGNILSKEDILLKAIDIEFSEIILQCKDEIIGEYNLIRECYQDNVLIYKCEGMSVPGII